MPEPFQLSDEQQRAVSLVNDGHSIFLTGAGGTGKSETLNRIIEQFTQKRKTFAVCASTGIAAVRIGGCTIHSCLGTGILKNIEELKAALDRGKMNIERMTWKLGRLDAIIFDEISMISGDQIEMFDWWLRRIHGTKKPFGGIQMVLSGDFLQLPPVIRRDDVIEYEYAPASPAWQQLDPEIVYLTKIFRQEDAEFIEHLARVRYGEADDATIDYFNQRVGRKLKLPTRLYAKNDKVDKINSRELQKLSSRLHTFHASFEGDDRYFEKLARDCIVPEHLELKEGASVLFARNKYDYVNFGPPWYINGERGIVKQIDDDGICVEKDDATVVTVTPETWSLYDHQHRIIATMRQYPLKLAWAITIHKSQGATLTEMLCDVSECFSHGHVYVALSRVKSLAGLSLSRPMKAKDIYADPDVVQWYRMLEQ